MSAESQISIQKWMLQKIHQRIDSLQLLLFGERQKRRNVFALINSLVNSDLYIADVANKNVNAQPSLKCSGFSNPFEELWILLYTIMFRMLMIAIGYFLLLGPFEMMEESGMEQIRLKLHEIIVLDVCNAQSNVTNNIKSHWTYMLFFSSFVPPLERTMM